MFHTQTIMLAVAVVLVGQREQLAALLLEVLAELTVVVAERLNYVADYLV